MTRFSNSTTQRQRTKENPLSLGVFSETSLRLLEGRLGPENKVVGRADTNQQSNGGYGGGTMNHWFQVTITAEAWLILKKGEPRPNYIEVSAYDLNQTPIQGRMIFQNDSISTTSETGEIYYPYFGQVMGAQSNLYNEFDRYSLNKGDELYFILEKGSYLICVSSTRNEPLDYTLGLVVEFPELESFILLEDTEEDFLILEATLDASNTVIIGPVFSSDYTLTASFNAYTPNLAVIEAGVTVTIPAASTWLIAVPVASGDDSKIKIEPGDNYNVNSQHEHSRTEWVNAWKRERDPDAHFPELFETLTNRP